MTLPPPPVPYKILMGVHGRPIYTYMTLDSVQRTTLSPYRLTVIHHRTEPTQNDEILDSFLRRGVIRRLEMQTQPEFDWTAYMEVFRSILEPEDEFVFFLEDDVVIEPTPTCWIETMVAAMRDDPKLAMVGSAVDKSDYIDPAVLAADLGRDLTRRELREIKSDSPERKQTFPPDKSILTRQNVAGRFLGFRLAALADDLPNVDQMLDKELKRRGWKTGTLATVRHRHLSLLNYYDYPEYQGLRNQHVEQAKDDGQQWAGPGGKAAD